MIVFLDACALIYLLEGEPALAERVRRTLLALTTEHDSLRIAVSRLSWLECRVGPLKANVPGRLALFDEFFARPDLIWVELDRNVVELATEIRARYGTRPPDALQAACCLQLGPSHRFLTGDQQFQRISGLQVLSVV